jgi:hypothetical protein
LTRLWQYLMAQGGASANPLKKNLVSRCVNLIAGDRALLPPSPPRSLLLKSLTPASGRQDHTTSPSARKARSSMRSLRPPHPVPTSVTIAKRPSVWARTARDMQVIWLRREWKYFCEGGWTAESHHPPTAGRCPSYQRACHNTWQRDRCCPCSRQRALATSTRC